MALLLAVVALVAAACGASPSRPASPELVTRCGVAEFPFGATDLTGEPVDDAARRAFDEAGEAVAVEWFGEGSGFGGGWEWVVVERDDGRMVFLGSGPNGYADVVIEHDGERWQAAQWGGCHPITAATEPGMGIATWIVDPDVPPDPASSTVDVLVMERECASGNPPVGREIRPVVVTGTDVVEIVVLIEGVSGMAECPSNPWHPTTIDLGEALGDRTLVDRHVTPGLVRPWPPTESSLSSGGTER